MTMYERIIRLPALVISRASAEQIAAQMNELAEQRITVLLEERLRGLHRARR